MSYVYILRSLKKLTYYIGFTRSPERRLIERNAGINTSTRPYIPWEMIFKQNYPDKKKALSVEAKLKKYKSKVILEKIVKDGYIKGD